MDEQIDYNSIQKDTRGNLREAPIQENPKGMCLKVVQDLKCFKACARLVVTSPENGDSPAESNVP